MADTVVDHAADRANEDGGPCAHKEHRHGLCAGHEAGPAIAQGGQQLCADVVEQLAEDHLTDDDGSQTDNDSATAHVDVAGALILGQQRAGERHKTVREHQAQHDIGVGVDALRARHVGVCAGCAQGAAALRAEEPVQKRDHAECEKKQHWQRIFQTQVTHKALRHHQRVFIHADGLIGFAVHDAQVNGIERKLRQNAGQDRGNAAFGVEHPRDKACQHPTDKRAQQRQPRVHARADQHDSCRTAGGDGAVDGQIRNVQNTEGDVHADGHQAPDEALSRRAGQRIE